MKCKCIFFSIAILVFSACFPAQDVCAETLVTVAADENIYKRYRQFLSQEKQSAKDVASLKSSVANRPVAEIVLAQQAIEAGGLSATIEFVITPNAARDIVLVEEGEALMAAHTVFSSDISRKLYRSETVIPVDSFVKGIYTTPENKNVLEVGSLDELRKFKAVSSTAWTADWATLQRLGLKEVYSAPTYESMIKMVAHGRGDFALLEFPNKNDLSLELFGVRLVPVPGLTIGIKESRHFVVSKSHPDGRKVFEALQRGLQTLKEEGRIKRYMQDVGFYNFRVADWKLINPTKQ